MTLLTLHQVADSLQVHWSTVRALASDGLRVVKLGKSAKSWRVDPADLAEYLARKKTCQSESKPPPVSTLSRPMQVDTVLAEARQHLKRQKELSKPPVWTHRDNGLMVLKKPSPST